MGIGEVLSVADSILLTCFESELAMAMRVLVARSKGRENERFCDIDLIYYSC